MWKKNFKFVNIMFHFKKVYLITPWLTIISTVDRYFYKWVVSRGYTLPCPSL